MKINIELILDSNKSPLFLNFWDWSHGNDVNAEFLNGKLIQNDKEITLSEFIDQVNTSIEKQ